MTAKRKYVSPVIETYMQKDLKALIEAGACSNNQSCHCYSGGQYA